MSKEMTEEQLHEAEKHIEAAYEAYRSVPDGTGIFALALTINPLRYRLKQGDRTVTLYNEIMEVKL